MLQSSTSKASSSAATIKQNITQSSSNQSKDSESVMSSFLTSPNPLHGITMAATNLSSSSATSTASSSGVHTGSSGQWEELRRQARVLENEVDSKLVSFSKLCANYTSGATARKYHAAGPRPGVSSDGGDSVLVSRVNSDQQFENSARELEQQLARLTRIIDQMSAHLQNLPAASTVSNGTQSGAALLHTVQRHRDILADYRHEFQKTKANIMSLRERSELIGPSGNSAMNNSGMSSTTSLYLKEHEHLRSSERLVDDQISIAIATKEHLVAQRARLNHALNRLQITLQRFPLVNNALQKINLRRRRDAIIVGAVIGICFILLFLYVFH